ncbi:NAD-dependent alcohol dehydrogenase [Candidatus Nitrososphaera gargensis Ga9.2]|uniref:NAD-dependent alcohol dehydrogenase n=1 Tax=Nitrososphaera gargensis (strain Ga9.2) TaxID=1237085 RepID=K0IF44_NITGG|nr:alcohol dehydrogenase catalytic domain-containing protein [Candidatus Nitrososphaera gargensis]AFU57428.1 NAD-dependent alcohol dehydrogenase [Candidatus Nitrososphaera gargensis Ga9.2]
MAEKMRAMVLTKLAPIETRPLKLMSIDRPVAKGRNELMIEIEACGVCRSNLHLIEGDWKRFGAPSHLPVVPGHEVVGVVKQVGSGVKKIKVGDRVGIQPLFSSCLQCEYCTTGKENLCESAEITGETVQGGYAEYISALEEFVTPIPDNLDSEHAAPLFCPGITAYKAVKASEPAAGRTVGIFGIGGVGHLAIQIAKMQGARVIAMSRAKKHLDLSKKLGADNVIVYQDSQGQFLKNLKKEEGGLLDSAIVFAPSDKVIDTAIKSVKKGGTIVLGVLGNVSDFPTFEEKIVKGSVIGTMKDMAELVSLASSSGLKVVIETHKLEEANEVLARLKKSQVEARAVLVP